MAKTETESKFWPAKEAKGAKGKHPEAANTSRKRKAAPSSPTEGVRKSARRAHKAMPSPQQALKYLLSKDAATLCRPEDEAKDLESHSGEPFVTYADGVLSPFQELLCAVVLSRPISHRLGLRTIRTLFYPPYELTSAKKIMDAGPEKLKQALWDARTQHKAKTADQLHYLADYALDLLSDKDDTEGSQLGPILAHSNANTGLDRLVKEIKGFGPTGRQIFQRRVQWLWEAAYPFIDDRSRKALEELGLPSHEEGLTDLIEEAWDTLDAEKIEGKDDAEKKRRALVVVLERAIEADLEGKMDRVKEEATKLE